MTKGAIRFALVLFGMLTFILVLPIEQALKGQILGFLGIIISAGIALSSTTILGNLIAGIMNNTMNRFKSGDLIKIGDYHGRVVEKSIFHTEIQLEDSNFITIPNLYIANNPVKLTRKMNSVISTSVSLSYDVPRTKVEEALKLAAKEIGLKDPYVYITSLGDYSVVYKIHGFLEDSSKYFSTNSLLNAKVMDHLHAQKIEIVSPTFMNQRRVDEVEFIPKEVNVQTESIPEKAPEELIFDEAIKSEKLANSKEILKEIDAKINQLSEELKSLKEEKEQDKVKAQIQRYKDLKLRMEQRIKEQIERDKNLEL